MLLGCEIEEREKGESVHTDDILDTNYNHV
jgi:hypothetical protein